MASRRPFHSFRTDSPPTLDSLSFTRCLDNKSIPDRVWNLATYPYFFPFALFEEKNTRLKGALEAAARCLTRATARLLETRAAVYSIGRERHTGQGLRNA